MLSGFYHKVADNCTVLDYYAASSGNISYHYSLHNNPGEQVLRKYKLYCIYLILSFVKMA